MTRVVDLKGGLKVDLKSSLKVDCCIYTLLFKKEKKNDKVKQSVIFVY